MIHTDYLRPKKAEAVRRMQESGARKRDRVKSIQYEDALILPVRKFETDSLQFGR